jgi:O-antigen/teichoic acid export membrane protein
MPFVSALYSKVPPRLRDKGLLRFAKNALSNVVNGVSSAVFAIVLPFFFVRTLTAAEFALWILVLQLGAYVGYLNFGLQVAIGRYVAHALERGDRKFAEQILSAGLQILAVLGVISFLVIGCLAWGFPHIFAQVPANLVATARMSLLLVGGALSLGLPVLGLLGVFIGLQRNDIPAVTGTVSKVVMGVALVFTAYVTRNISAVCVVYLVCNVITYAAQCLIFRRICGTWRINVLNVEPAARRELISYCASLTVWSLGTLVINGMQTTIVGIFDFSSVGAYGSALNIVTFLSGIAFTVTSPLVQVFAKQHAQDKNEEMVRLLHATSFICTLTLFFTGAWMIILSPPFFVGWVRSAIAATALPIFAVLVLANVIRGIAFPYVNYLIASGRQRQVIVTPLLEAFVNLSVGLFMVEKVGAIGMAIGTLAGGIVALAANFTYNMPRTLPNSTSPFAMLRTSVLYPVFYCLPLLLVVALRSPLHLSLNLQLILGVLASGLPAYGFLNHRGGLHMKAE